MPKKQKRNELSPAAWAALGAIIVALIGAIAAISQALINKSSQAPSETASIPSPHLLITQQDGTSTPIAMITSPMVMGWTRYELPTEKFSIGLPSGWQVLDISPQGLENTISLVVKPNSDLGISTEMLGRLVAMGVKFYAIYYTPESLSTEGYTMVNVIVLDTGLSMPRDVFVNLNLQQIEKSASGTIPVTHQPVTISGIDAEEYTYSIYTPTYMSTTGTPLPEYAITQYTFMENTKQYAITFVVPIKTVDVYNESFKEIAMSFLLVK